MVQSTFSAGAAQAAKEDDETRQRLRLAALASQWLLLERLGAPLRYAHKAAEWDGWEEGLVSTVLGEGDPEDMPAKSQFRGVGVGTGGIIRLMDPAVGSTTSYNGKAEKKVEEPLAVEMKRVCANLLHPGTSHGRLAQKEARRKHGGHLDHVLSLTIGSSTGSRGSSTARARAHTVDSAQQTSSAELTPGGAHSSSVGRALSNLVLSNNVNGGQRGLTAAVAAGARRKSHGACVDDVTDGAEREMEKMLDMRGDVCGGRGGELGRRLEAWLVEGEEDGNDADAEDVDDGNMPMESPTLVGVTTH